MTAALDAAAARLCHPDGDGGYGPLTDDWRETLAQIRREKSLLASRGLALRVDDRRLNLGQKALHFVAHALKFFTQGVLGRASDAVQEHQGIGIGEGHLAEQGLEGAFEGASAPAFFKLNLCDGGQPVGQLAGEPGDVLTVLIEGLGDDGLKLGRHGGFLLNLRTVPRVAGAGQ